MALYGQGPGTQSKRSIGKKYWMLKMAFSCS
jgi:hypothetical protein